MRSSIFSDLDECYDFLGCLGGQRVAKSNPLTIPEGDDLGWLGASFLEDDFSMTSL